MSDNNSGSPHHAPAASVTPRRRNWLAIALCVSLAINLLIAGLVIGARINGGPPHANMLNNSAFSIGRAIRQFDGERSAELWPIARPHFKGIRPEIRKLRDAQRSWERSFGAQEVDLAQLDSDYAILQKQISIIQQMNFKAIRALAGELSASERKQLLRALRNRQPTRRAREHDRQPTH